MPTWSSLIVRYGLLCAAAGPAAAQGFFTGIGVPDGQNSSSAEDISANGLVVSGDSGLFARELIRWTLEGGIESLTPGQNGDTDGGINGLGTVIAGGFFGGGTRHALRWTASTGAVSIGDLDGGRFRSIATGVSSRGDIIVGGGYSDAGGEAFRWTEQTGMVGLGDLPGGPFASSAGAISADGLVIVGGSWSTDTGVEAYRWTEQTGMVGLGDLSGGSITASATAVSADGAVVVGSGYDADSQRGFRWTEQTGMIALEKIHPDQLYQRAFGTSWDGSVIVGEAGVIGSGSYGAFYWTAEDGTRRLVDVLAEHGVIVPEWWHLDRAYAVSADGRTIVGTGFNTDRVATEGWVAYLGPACRADYDENGSVDVQDVVAYLSAWAQRSIFADWNYDGHVNTRDVIGFLREWAAGC